MTIKKYIYNFEYDYKKNMDIILSITTEKYRYNF